MYHSHMDECQLSIKYRNITKHDIRICFYQICQQTYFFMIKLFPNWSILLFEKFDSWEIYFNFTKSNITTNTHTHTHNYFIYLLLINVQTYFTVNLIKSYTKTCFSKQFSTFSIYLKYIFIDLFYLKV